MLVLKLAIITLLFDIITRVVYTHSNSLLIPLYVHSGPEITRNCANWVTYDIKFFHIFSCISKNICNAIQKKIYITLYNCHTLLLHSNNIIKTTLVWFLRFVKTQAHGCCKSASPYISISLIPRLFVPAFRTNALPN